MSKSIKIKKGPGRPRKVPIKKITPRGGIKKSPIDKENLVEFAYENPILLKKTFGFFKSLASSEIQIIFRKTEVIIYSQDHHNKSKVRIRIDANKLNHYYCKPDEIELGLTCKNVELILNKTDKDYNNIQISINKGNERKCILFSMETCLNILEEHNIEIVSQYHHMEHEDNFLKTNHVINLTLPGKYFKKTINDMKNIAKDLIIGQDDNESPVVFKYTSDNKKIKSNHKITNNDKVKLVSNLKEDETFLIEIKIEYIKPISSIQLAESITISLDENLPFMTTTYLDDKTIEIKTLTDIIDSRKKN